MQAIKCELCGSTEMVKDDGYFVCQYCKTKYTVEEAKKMMVEVVVSVDNTEKQENLRLQARRAKDSNDWINTEKYYSKLVDLAPNDWEAVFYSALYSARQNFPVGNIDNELANIDITKSWTGQISVAYDLIAKISGEDERQAVLNQASKDLLDFYENCEAVLNISPNASLYVIAGQLLETVATKIYSAESLNQNTVWAEFYKLYNQYMAQTIHDWTSEDLKEAREKYENAINRIKEIESDYTPPTQESKANASNSSGGCYIATAVYGSYDCPQVWTLRRYRDTYLAQSWHGRTFIRAYYAVSPTLVKCFGGSGLFHTICRKRLDYLVSKLERLGINNAFYSDIEI